MNGSDVKKSGSYSTVVIGIIIFAFIATSFDRSILFFSPEVLSLGGHSLRYNKLESLLKIEYALLKQYGYSTDNTFNAVLEKIINDELLSIEAKNFDINVSQEMVRAHIQKTRLFADNRGQFDDEKLQKFLVEAKLGITEFLNYEKRRMINARLKTAMLEQVTVPSVLTELAISGAWQERNGAYKEFFPPKEAPNSFKPTEQNLLELFNKTPIKSPEYRTFSFLKLSPNAFLSNIKITPDEISKANFGKISKDKLIAKIQLEKARAYLENLIIKIEGLLGEGKSLQDIAKQYSLEFYTLTTDAKGQTIAGAQAEPLSFADVLEADVLRKAILTKVFFLEPNQFPDHFQLPSSDFVLLQVEKVAPEKLMNFEEAKPYLERQLYAQKQTDIAVNAAEKFLSSGSAENMKNLPPLTVNTKIPNVPDVVKDALFQLQPGASMVINDSGKVYAVKLNTIKSKSMPEDGDKEQFEVLIKNELTNFFWDAYLLSLKQKYGVTINQKELRRFKSMN